MRRNYQAAGVTHDEHGYRVTGEARATTSRQRIVAIGDSFTYGLGVEDQSTYAAVLSRKTDSEVVNMGVNAYGIDQAILAWEQHGIAFKPQAVVLGYFYDDLHRAASQLREFPKPRFTLSPQGDLQLHATPDCRNAISMSSEWRLPKLAAWSWGKFRDRFFGYPTAFLEERLSLGRALLQRLRDTTQAVGAELIVLLIPHCQHPKEGAYADWIIRRTKSDCETLKISCIDFREGFRHDLYGANCHWSVIGHELAATRISQILNSIAAK